MYSWLEERNRIWAMLIPKHYVQVLHYNTQSNRTMSFHRKNDTINMEYLLPYME